MRPMTGDWQDALGLVISAAMFFGIMIVCHFYTEWIEEDMKKHPGKHKFFEQAWRR